MTVYYLDSSGWVKRYFLEQGSEWILSLFESHDQMASASLGYIEVAATLARREGRRRHPSLPEGSLRNVLEAHWQKFAEAPVESSVLELARALAWEKRLRGADAVHLGAADVLRQRLAKHSVGLTLVTADVEMVVAARSIDLDVINPTTIL